jgi:hypothetical protein
MPRSHRLHSESCPKLLTAGHCKRRRWQGGHSGEIRWLAWTYEICFTNNLELLLDDCMAHFELSMSSSNAWTLQQLILLRVFDSECVTNRALVRALRPTGYTIVNMLPFILLFPNSRPLVVCRQPFAVVHARGIFPRLPSTFLLLIGARLERVLQFLCHVARKSPTQLNP